MRDFFVAVRIGKVGRGVGTFFPFWLFCLRLCYHVPDLVAHGCIRLFDKMHFFLDVHFFPGYCEPRTWALPEFLTPGERSGPMAHLWPTYGPEDPQGSTRLGLLASCA